MILAVGIGTCASGAHVTEDADLMWRPAIDLVLSAFERHQLVAVSEGAGHGQLETRNFVAGLIRDRRFAPIVRNLVIEFGNARYQAVLDRYVTGEPVTRDELRHVWEDTTQVSGVWSLPMYEQMLADVRFVNEDLPPATRIRVIAGDPPIDWAAVTSPADEDMNDWRDAHFAYVIEREVMRKRARALILIGGAHISRKVMCPNSLIHLLDLRFPGRHGWWECSTWNRSSQRPEAGFDQTLFRLARSCGAPGSKNWIVTESVQPLPVMSRLTLMRYCYWARRGFTLNLQHHSIRPTKES